MTITTELISRFICKARAAAATVERVPRDPRSVAGAVLAVASGARGLLLSEPDFLPAGLFDTLKQAPGVVSAPTDDQMAAAETGVSGAFAAVARTGSVCVRNGRGLDYSVGLFTRSHIVVLAAETIVARPRDVFDHPVIGKISAESDFVFITGPSATADMGSLVRGVHGPGSLHILLLDEP